MNSALLGIKRERHVVPLVTNELVRAKRLGRRISNSALASILLRTMGRFHLAGHLSASGSVKACAVHCLGHPLTCCGSRLLVGLRQTH